MNTEPSSRVRWYSLSPAGDPLGVSCDDDGPGIGPVRLLQRDEDGLSPRSIDDLRFILSRAFGYPIDFTSKMGGLEAVARALDRGNLSHAMVTTLVMRLPELPDEAAFQRAVVADTLAKAGYNSDEPRDERGRRA